MEYYKYLRTYVGHKPIILPGSVVIILNDQNEVLLQKRHDGYWGLPGGLMDLGESFEEVAKREVFEETGLIVKNLQLLNVFSGSKYYLKISNGDELYSVTAVFYSRDVSGDMNIDYSESVKVQYFSINNLPNELTDEYKEFIEQYIEMYLK
ncbi:NUDIX hydrolase [Peribacillus psychrosaccharolyticus]|uniref:NUDIX hydrolase n=1 Tax=Peribacillus psychrosaccharolyticus TaxID=1407 RepID=A0A974NMB8_PERPY|nr:NUDIX hydrolase [Peribacillus psychrosaccharolyticus]MEC2056507.1 NUDIX hydrolase [Peribacillus psychrosaccharolyticus]MED3745639.1 NUDIX hydrolase [Peribacillus psychrosaccharolyticus]QQT00346.1 NUDIX hydrolase [Peribacillus psychrosaccharolyticus]